MSKKFRKALARPVAIALAAAIAATSAPVTSFAEEVPAVETAVEETPVVEEEAPAEETPAVEEETPAEETPVAEEEAPAEETPAAEEETPAEETPAAEEEAPAEETPAAEEEAPAEETPAVEEETPAEEAPAAEEETPVEEITVVGPGIAEDKEDPIVGIDGKPATPAEYVLDQDENGKGYLVFTPVPNAFRYDVRITDSKGNEYRKNPVSETTTVDLTAADYKAVFSKEYENNWLEKGPNSNPATL